MLSNGTKENVRDKLNTSLRELKPSSMSGITFTEPNETKQRENSEPRISETENDAPDVSHFTRSVVPIGSHSREGEFVEAEAHLKSQLQGEEAVLETNEITMQNLVKEINILKKRNYELLDQIKETDSKTKVSKTQGSETIMAEVD